MNPLPIPSSSYLPFSPESLHASENEEIPSPSPQGQSTDQIQTMWDPYWNRFRVLAAYLASFANGMNDAAPEALIASIEK
jgi:hypothetical protein